MRSSFTKIAAALLFAIALFSCNFDTMGSDKGAITMRLPDQSQLNAIASSGALAEVSRSVSSGGSISAGAVDQFKVVVRNISSHESITQFVAPGSSITVDELEPGSWDVAIFGYASTGTSGDPIYYGNARGIAVEGGETSNATVGLYNISGNMPGFGFNGIDSSAATTIGYAYMTWSCAELGQSGEDFYSFDSYDTSFDSSEPIQPPIPIFMEPGYSYNAKITFFVTGGQAKYTGTAEGIVPAAGGLVIGNTTELDKLLTPVGSLNGPYVIGNSFVDFIDYYYSEFSLDGTQIPCTNASYKAVYNEVCGLAVPYIASYGIYSCIFMPTVYHPTIVPSVSVSNKTIQKGQTITVSPSLNPPSPKEWPTLTKEAYVNGFRRYIVDSATTYHDTWAHALICSDPNADKVTVNDTNKTLTGAAAGSNNFTWTVTVTASADTFGETPAQNTATANFTATCVEATQPSGGGGGSGNVPADFVFVEGATINTAISGSNVFLDGRKITIPDMYVCTHEVTQKEYTEYMHQPDFDSYYGLGDNYPANYVGYYEAIVYCNLRSVIEGRDPVYYIIVDSTNDTDSMDYPVGTRSYDVAEWKTKVTNSPTSLGPYTKIKQDPNDGKYYDDSPSSLYTHWAYPCRGFTMDKGRNGYRLLTEAEWEYCARGGKNGIAGTQTIYSGSDTIGNVAWYTSNSGYKMHPITEYEKTSGIDSANLLGIYDMCGNIGEWVYDWYGWKNINKSTPETGYVYTGWNNQSQILKGGYFGSGDSYCTINERAMRGTYRSNDSGFRICCNKDTRTITGFNGTWCLSPPMARTISSTGVVDFKIFNDAATSSDYANIDKSKLVVEYGDTSGNVEHTYTGESDGVIIEPKSDGVVWKINNPNTATSGGKMYRFYYDGVEIAYNRVFAD